MSLGKLSNVSALDYVRKSGDNWNPPNRQTPPRAVLCIVSDTNEVEDSTKVVCITSPTQPSAGIPACP